MRLADKRVLMALAFDPAPEMKVALYSEKTYPGGYRDKVKNYIAGARVENDTLILTAYSNEGVPIYRTFQQADDLFSQFPVNEKLSEATLETITGQYYGIYHMNAEDTNLIRAWCKNNAPFSFSSNGNTGFEVLRDYQKQLRKEQLARRYNKIKERTDAKMRQITPLEPAVMEWVDEELMKEYRCIFYDYHKGKKKQRGWCTHCHQEVEIEHPKHRAQGECPHCHSKVFFLATGKFKDHEAVVRGDEWFCYIQPTDEGWCLRYFQVYLYSNSRIRTGEKYTLLERHRCFYSLALRGYTGFYDWGNFRQTGEMRFYDTSERWMGSCRIYPGTMEAIRQKDKQMRFVPLQEIACHIKTDPSRLLLECMAYPIQMEYFAKAGLYRMLGEIVSGYGPKMPQGKTPQEIFGLSGQTLKEILSINPTWRELDAYRKISQYQRIDIPTFHRLYGRIEVYSRLASLTEYLSLTKIEHYLDKQVKAFCRGGSEDHIVIDWLDYLNACKKLGYDLTDDRILRPKDLTKAHDDATALAKEKENQRTAQRIEQAAQKWSGYAWQSDGLLIRPIRSYRELVTEGQKLKHCVANYAKSYADGSCKLFCIRKQSEPDTPYYTLELGKEDRLVQYRGYRNDAENNYQPQEEVRRFVTQWMKKIVETPKDKKQHIKVTAA